MNHINPTAQGLSNIGTGYFRLLKNSADRVSDCLILDIDPGFVRISRLPRETLLNQSVSALSDKYGFGTACHLEYLARVLLSGKTQETVHWVAPLNRRLIFTVLPLGETDFTLVLREAREDVPPPEAMDVLFCSQHLAVSLIRYGEGKYRYIRNNSMHQLHTGFANISGAELCEVVGPDAYEEITKYYEQSMETGRPVRFEREFNFVPGKRIWQTEITPIHHHGKVYYLLCSSRDLTELRQLRQEKDLLQTTLKSIGDGVVTTDNSGRITSMNTVAQSLTGWGGEEAMGKDFSQVMVLQSEGSGLPVESPVRKVLKTGLAAALPNRTELISLQGKRVSIADSTAPIQNEDGQISGVVMVFRDVAEDQENCRKIQFLSYHDPLTGLKNRRYVEEALASLDCSENLPLSVIMGDVNGLKFTNDVFGHRAGDALLIHVAELLTKHCAQDALIARWGGDEFVAILPKTSLSMVEGLIQNIKNDRVSVDECGLHLSLSLGCAVKEQPEISMEGVLREAEEYMYHQKLLDGKSYRNAIINTLLATLYEKSMETEEHSKRLEENCHTIGQRLFLSSKEMDELSLLALLHDLGKVGIDPGILKKPGTLLPEDWDEMKRHPEIGYRIAQATSELAVVADYILSHHERWDGAGYPRGLKGKDIPLPCRILAVTDAYDAMTNDRVYRKAMSREEALQEIQRNAGSQFDPTITYIFLDTMNQARPLNHR